MVRRILQGVGAAFMCCALLVWLTGGFTVSAAGIRVSSHRPWNPLLAAALMWLVAAVLARPEVRRTLTTDGRWWAARLPWPGVPGRVSLLGACAVAIIWSIFEIQQWAGARPLWLDEQMVALNIRERSAGSLAGPLWLGQSAPYGWLLLQRMALTVLGDGESALRLVPLLFGIATLAAALWIARTWMVSAGSVVLVLLCATGQWVSFYVFELKHYSADVFWALWLPALAAWVITPTDHDGLRRRVTLWWLMAAAGQWTANGALFVTPACAVIMLAGIWRRQGWRALGWPALGAMAWALSFALHYVVSIRHTLDSAYLLGYWEFSFPPVSAGLGESLNWVASRLGPLAEKPGGTAWATTFWICAGIGWILRRRGLGVMMAAVPATACLLAMLRLVPLYERLTLWIIPAVYVGIALAADHVLSPHVWRLRQSGRPRTVITAVMATTLLIATGLLVRDLVGRGHQEVHRDTTTNHRLDDRQGVTTLLAGRRAGDVVISTRLGLPAIWWYGRVLVGGPGGGTRFVDGSPILEATYEPPSPLCSDPGRLSSLTGPAALNGTTRALVYLGFRFDDVPDGFDQLMLDELSTVGTITEVPRFHGWGRGAILTLGETTMSAPRLPPLEGRDPVHLDGCINLVPAERW
jgi:hypothetical protein